MENLKEFIDFLESKGFKNDRSWSKNINKGYMFYSFGRGVFHVEIKENWNIPYNWYEPLVINILDCNKEYYSGPDSGYIGWMGQVSIQLFKGLPSKTLFSEIFEFQTKEKL